MGRVDFDALEARFASMKPVNRPLVLRQHEKRRGRLEGDVQIPMSALVSGTRSRCA